MSGETAAGGRLERGGEDPRPRHAHLRYRPDIDGLRAVAVLAVVAFHAGLWPVTGGFVGVDVFFVISGYLITSLIVQELERGAFSLTRFYERRIRRIFPALFTVLAACALFAFLVFAPEDMRQFSRTLTATALFVSNFFFASRTDYFDAPLDTHPLLHTWSLAVEEQFYIVFPLLLLLTYRFGRKVWAGAIGALFVVSLAASVWLTNTDPAAAFFVTPTRAWELMLGALLAAGAVPAIRSQAVREVAALAGIGLIGLAVFAFSPETPFPGWTALVPCLGTALLIQSAGHGAQSTVSRALSLKPVVFVGLISYSLYLWHWPLLVFARYVNFGPLDTLQVVGIVAASFLLAALSWAFIEQPFRRKGTPIGRPVLFRAAAAAIAVTVAFAGAGVWTDGFLRRYPAEIVSVLDAASAFDRDKALKSCLRRAPGDACVFGAPVKPAYAVWGDSHALVLLRAIGEIAAQHGKSIKAYVSPGCPPVADLDRKGKACAAFSDTVLQDLESSKDIGTVILISRFSQDVDPAGQGLTGAGGGQPLARQLKITVDRLRDAGKTVVMVYPVPEAGFPAPAVIGRLLASGRDPASQNTPFAAFERREKDVFAILDRTGAEGGVIRVYPHKFLCDRERCLVYDGGAILYRDTTHLTEAGAALVAPAFAPIFAGD